MSYKCDNCKETFGKHMKPTKKVTVIRRKDYPPRFEGKEQIDPGGHGTEIVKEENLCPSCARISLVIVQ